MLLEIELLEKWFEANKRSFPWREEISPYRVWISEVMLQQTRASVVVNYFLRWMESFPTIFSLASAPIEVVIKAWEGLGYYSRARNIHKAANIVVEKFQGQLPSDADLLKSLPGFGPYTVGAICSFAFKQKMAAVDGNVLRVLSRYFAIEEDISKSATIKKIYQKASKLLPENSPWIAMEALIELGATLCNKKPNCFACPLKNSCKGFQEGKAAFLPIKNAKIKAEKIYRLAAIFCWEDKIAVCKRAAKKIMADLYEFPYICLEEAFCEEKSKLLEMVSQWDLEGEKIVLLPKERHAFTRYKAEIQPVIIYCNKQKNIPEAVWLPVQQLVNYPFSSGHRRILESFLQLNLIKS